MFGLGHSHDHNHASDDEHDHDQCHGHEHKPDHHKISQGNLKDIKRMHSQGHTEHTPKHCDHKHSAHGNNNDDSHCHEHEAHGHNHNHNDIHDHHSPHKHEHPNHHLSSHVHNHEHGHKHEIKYNNKKHKTSPDFRKEFIEMNDLPKDFENGTNNKTATHFTNNLPSLIPETDSSRENSIINELEHNNGDQSGTKRKTEVYKREDFNNNIETVKERKYKTTVFKSTLKKSSSLTKDFDSPTLRSPVMGSLKCKYNY
jgi:hypothetical protein